MEVYESDSNWFYSDTTSTDISFFVSLERAIDQDKDGGTVGDIKQKLWFSFIVFLS